MRLCYYKHSGLPRRQHGLDTASRHWEAARRAAVPSTLDSEHFTPAAPADVFMVHGLFAQTLKPPLTPGSEGVGTVASFSERFPLGQRVVAGEGLCQHSMPVHS